MEEEPGFGLSSMRESWEQVETDIQRTRTMANATQDEFVDAEG